MKRFQSIIQKYITNHQKHKKYLAAVLALSILVSFAVPVSLIMPAVSMTQNDTNENYAQPLNNEIETYTNESTGTNEWFDTASDNGEGVDFENNITSITITDATKDSNGDYVINGGSGSSWSGSFTLNYARVNDGVLGENNPYMHFKINDVKITNAQYGKDCLFIDPSTSWKGYCSDNNLLDNQGQPATSGYYSISENGMINIRFTSDYRNYLKSTTCEGSITFEGSIERGDDADGDREFTIGNNKIKVNFDDKNLGIRKSADWNFYGTDGSKIRWTITIENGSYAENLSGYTVDDPMFSRGENFKFNPENVGSVDSNGVFRFNESCKDSNGKYPDYITITYETPITDDDIQLVTNQDGTENIYSGNFKVSNIAKLKKPDGTETPSNEATKEIPKNEIKSTITKSGTPSYAIDGSKGYIEWTIEVNRQHGLPIKDYVITDEAFKNKDIKDITINGTLASITDTSKGTLTLGDVGSKAIIKYKVPVDKNSEQQYTNKASLTPPSDNKDEPKDTGDRTVTYKTDLFDVTKSGVLNDKNQLTWTITIDATINNNAGTLNGFKISDTQFTDAVTNGQLRIVSATNNNADVMNSVSLSGSGNEYTINGEADKITLEFTRPLTTDEINAQLGLTGNNTANATNTVTVEDKDGEKEEESGTATLTPLVDGIVKRLKSNNYAEETAGYDSDYLTSDKATKSLEWEVNIDHYRGFSSDSKVFVDVMNATNGGQHYMTREQLNTISISGTTIEGNDAGITSSDYTIEKIFDSNNKIIRFNVTFNGTVDTKKCVHLTIGYNTTADASNVVKGNTAVFSNIASFGGTDAPGGNFSFEVKDPANVPKHNLTANKSWAGDTPANRPDNITIRLERKTGENGWVEYAPSGQESTKTINKDSFDGYLCQWTDLEEYTPTADKTPYYYRVVELDGDNVVLNGGILGSYTVSYNENGITLNSNGTFTITNTRALADITVHKDWVGDEGKTKPNAVVHLEWKYEGNADSTYQRVDGDNGADVTLDPNNSYNHTWNNLPKKKDGRTVLYRVVENELADYVTSYTNNNGINSNGTINITNTYKMIDISVNKVWQDENGGNMSAPDDINSLKFQLQYKHADSFEPAGTATSITDTKERSGDTVKYHFTLPADVNAGDKIIFNITKNVYNNASGCLGWNGKSGWQKIEWNVTNTNGFTKEFIISDDIADNRYFEFQAYNNSIYYDIGTVEYQIQKKKDGAVSDWTAYPTDGTQEVQKASDGSFSYTWQNIPIVDEDGNLLEYQVVEVNCPKGYKASYSSSDNKNFTVTNKQSTTYSKQAIYPHEMNLNKAYTTMIEGTDFIIEPIDSITLDKLPTRTINEKEYYILEWIIRMNSKNNYSFEDELPDGAFLYCDEKGTSTGFGVIKNNNSNSYEVVVNIWQSWNNVYKANGNKINFDFSKENEFHNLKFIIYCTAIPKETVDSAVNTNGYYDVINKIKTNDEPNSTESKLTITKSTAPPVDESLLRKTLYVGKPDSLYYQNGTPTYELIVNPEGKNLVNGDTIDITDIFEITGYKPNGGTKTDGSDLLDVDFNEIQVQLIDENGKRIRDLLPNEYNRLTNTEEITNVETTPYDVDWGDFSDPYPDDGTNNWYYLKERSLVESGVEVCLEVSGNQGDIVDVFGYSGFTVEYDDVKYDENGKAKIRFIITEPMRSDLFFKSSNITAVQIISTQKVTRTTSQATKLQLSVPDEMPLKIVYSYKLKTNSKTPGNPAVGKTPPAGSVIYLKNAAEFETSSEKAFDEEKEMEFQISKSSATVNTTEYPTIKKVDIGNYSLELSAGFRIAKYDNGTWKYASQFNDVSDDKHKVVSHSPNFSIEESDGKVPTGSAKLETVAGGYKIVLESGALYKLVEVERPDGYIDLGYKSDSIVTGKKPYVFYFTYDGTISDETLDSLNNDLDDLYKLEKSDIMNFQKNSTLNIPNSNTFSIKVEKEWGIMPADYTPVSVDVKLGWSYSKLNKIPDSLNELSALGINGATKTITGIGENGTLPSVTWDNLPNGYDGKPIYYYVKEISYKLKDSNNIEKTYTLNNDGTYKCGDETGDFKPIYTGNGLNTGYSVEDGKVTGNVHIKNASKLVVKKVWQDSNGEEITDNLPLEEIQFNLDGIKEDGTTIRLVTKGTLSKSADWLTVIDDSVFDSSLNEESKELSQYKQFKVAEVITNDNQAIMYGYIVSDTYNVTEGSGEIVLTNKDKTPKDINVTVNKVWGDGNGNHTNDSIEVVLIRSNKSLTSSELKELNLDSLSNGITKVVEDNPFILNSENNWTKTWEELPYKEENGTQNYYYVLEKIIPDGYEVSYSHNGSLSSPVITINNNVPGSFRIDKSWVNASDTLITDTSSLPESIEVELYRRAKENKTQASTVDKSAEIKIMPIGDSITYGEGDSLGGSYRKYLYYELKKTFPNLKIVGKQSWTGSAEIDGENITFDNGHVGRSGMTIKSYNYDNHNRIGIYEGITNGDWKDAIREQKPDIILLLIGTNDIMDNYDMENIESRLYDLTQEIYKQYNDTKLFIMSPPPIVAGNKNTGDYLNQNIMDTNITNYIVAIKKVIARETNNNHYCKYIDINTEFKAQNDYATNLLSDYCHPNASGNRVIGNYITKQLETALGISSESVELEKDIPRLPSDFETNSSVYEKVDKITISHDENGNWSYNVSDLGSDSKDYVYYVKEIVPEGWEVSYEHNGQLGDSDTPIQIINKKTTEKTSITVNKQWIDGNAGNRPDITLTLQYKTSESASWTDVNVTQPTPTKNGATWTYTYSNLPKDDGNDNNYQYRIVETVPTGYTVEYVNGGVSGADGNISLTNTKSVSIKLNKIWSDNDHMGDTIIVKLHRSTTQKGDASLPLVMSINGQASMQTGSTQTLTANRNNIIWSSSDTNAATINSTGLVTAIKAGTTTITAKCGSETATFVITVSDKPTVQLAKSSVNITLGENASDLVTLLGISMSEGTATYSYSGYDSSVISISDGKVTALKAGNTTITVTATSGSDTSTATATINVNYPTFNVSDVSVAAGRTLNIAPDSHGGFEYTSNNDKITVDVNGNLSAENASAGDTATITVKRGTETKTINVTVTEASHEVPKVMDSSNAPYYIDLPNGYRSNIDKIVLVFDSTSSGWIDIFINRNGNYMGTIGQQSVGYDASDNIILSCSNYTTIIDFDNGTMDCLKFAKSSSGDFNATLKSLQVILANDSSYTITDFDNNTGTSSGSGSGGEDTSDYGTKVSGEYNSKYDSYGYSINDVEAGKVVKVTVVGTPNASVNGCFGYNDSSNSWQDSKWGDKNIGSDGKLVLEYTVPDNYKNGFQFQFWNWEKNGNTSSNITDVYYKVEAGAGGGDTGNYGTELSNQNNNGDNFKSEISGLKAGDKITVTLLGTPNNSVNGCFGYAVNTWSQSKWGDKNIGSDGKLAIEYTVPSNYNGEYFEFQIWNYSSSIVSKVYYKVDYGTYATATQSYSLRSASRAISRVNSVSPLAETSENITFNSEGVAEVKLTYTDVVNGQHWQKLIENLPAYDKNNQQYYYWVEEIEVNGYTASYYFDDASGDTEYCIDAAKLGSGEITIKNTKVESSSVTMPSTGGKGVKWYYVTGMAVMFVSAAGILIRRRKNPVK